MKQMIDQLKKFLICAGVLFLIMSYATDDAIRKIDAGILGLAMWILMLMFKKEEK